MSDPVSEVQTPETAAVETPVSNVPARLSPAEQPIPLWPEGVLAVVAGITLLVIGLRHRVYLQRKAQELQRAVEEFQRQGGMEDLSHVAKQAGDFLKGTTG